MIGHENIVRKREIGRRAQRKYREKNKRTAESRHLEKWVTKKNKGETLLSLDEWMQKYKNKKQRLANNPRPKPLDLCELNAVQAWKWWLKNSPDWWMKKYYDSLGKPWSNPRLTSADKWRIRYRLDPDFAVSERIRLHARKVRRETRFAEHLRMRLKRNGKSVVIQGLPYTITQLRAHIESQFTEGMNWEQFSKGKIHIDHVIPKSAFNLMDEDQWRKCWSLDNLQPLWASDNIRKGTKIVCSVKALM